MDGTTDGSEKQDQPSHGRSLYVLYPRLGEESAALTEDQARALWAAASAPWHPRVLERLGRLPALQAIHQAEPPGPADLRMLPRWASRDLASGYHTSAADSGCILFEVDEDRGLATERLLELLGPTEAPEAIGQSDESRELATDFQALGLAVALLTDLAIQMQHPDAINREALEREVMPAVQSWRSGDANATRNRLRGAFEILTQAREKFFPIDNYLVDFLLIDCETDPGSVRAAIEPRVAVTLLAAGEAIDHLRLADEGIAASLVQGVDEGWLDVVGGPYFEREETLLPIESVVWNYTRGSRAYRACLDERTVETFARRRFGFGPLTPQLARRFGMRYGFPFSFDGSTFPIPRESKRIWESADGSSIECLTRSPVNAASWAAGAQLVSRLAWTMKNDHVATVPLAHPAGMAAGWYDDLKRVARYSPVFGRFVTASDFFHLSDRPWDMLRPTLDDYQPPYLRQALESGSDRPVSYLIQAAEDRAELDAELGLAAMARLLERLSEHRPNPVPPGPEGSQPSEPEPIEIVREDEFETGRGANRAGCTEELDRTAHDLAVRLGCEAGPAQGWLILNTLSFARQVPVNLEPTEFQGASPARVVPGPLCRVVGVTGWGFAWVPHAVAERPIEFAPGCAADPEARVLRSSRFEVAFDPATGGLRGVRRPGEPGWRLGLQLVAPGLNDEAGAPAASLMTATGFHVEIEVPGMVQAVSSGQVREPGPAGRILAGFSIRVRLWEGRGTFDLEIELKDLDSEWLASVARNQEPWACGLACRWAWPDANAILKRSSYLGLEPTSSRRPDTSECFEIVARPHHTALLLGGLSYHQRHGTRMLDTLLLAGKETERTFRVGVAVDLENPVAAALDRLAPVIAVPMASAPRGAEAGWLLQLDSRSVQITRVGFSDATYDGRGWGLVVHLLETASKPTRCKLRPFLSPLWARQVDFQGELIVDLATADEAVQVDLTPREFAVIEVTLGLHQPA